MCNTDALAAGHVTCPIRNNCFAPGARRPLSSVLVTVSTTLLRYHLRSVTPVLLLLCLSVLVQPQQAADKTGQRSAQLFDYNVIPKLSA